MPSAYQLASIANAVYEHKPVAESWALLWRHDRRALGFAAAVYSHRSQPVVGVAYRGTDDGRDLVPDAQLFFGVVPNQLPEARAVADAARRTAAGLALYVTGHSLGGGLAVLIAAERNLPAVTLNAPGVAKSFVAQFAGGQALVMNDSRILNIRASFDAVSVGTGPQLGRVVTVSLPQRPRPAPSPSQRVWDSGFPSIRADRRMVDSAAEVYRQHGCALMVEHLRGLPQFTRELGWH